MALQQGSRSPLHLAVTDQALGQVHKQSPSDCIMLTQTGCLQVLQLAAGDQHSAALTASGFLFTWGCNDQGQLGLPAVAEHMVQVSTSI